MGQSQSAPRGAEAAPCPWGHLPSVSPLSVNHLLAVGGKGAGRPGDPRHPVSSVTLPQREKRPVWLPSFPREDYSPVSSPRASGLSGHSEHPLAPSVRDCCMAAGPESHWAHTTSLLPSPVEGRRRSDRRENEKECMLGLGGDIHNSENYVKNITLNIILHFSEHFHFPQWLCSVVIKGMVPGVRFPGFLPWHCD